MIRLLQHAQKGDVIVKEHDYRVEIMQNILNEADKDITAIMVQDETIWICGAVSKSKEMGVVMQKLHKLFNLDDDDYGYAPVTNNNYMKAVGGYYVER